MQTEFAAAEAHAVTGARTRLGIVYPADPGGLIPGGIDTFIRGIIRWAPPDIDVSVVGVTTDPGARPVGGWTTCTIGPAVYRHYSVFELKDVGRQTTVPATLRFIVYLLSHAARLRAAFDVLEFHRIEPIAAFLRDPTPKTAVLHQNMDVIRSTSSDIRWRHLPGLYFAMERFLLPRLDSAFCVREDAVASYRQRYPELAARFRFTPTWMDPEVFHAVDATQRARLRDRLFGPLQVRDSDRVLVSVGRLDRQKDPLLLCAAFAELCRTRADLRLVFVGDGVLRSESEAMLKSLGLSDRVMFAGVRPPAAVAEYLNASDLFVLASAYEGMPMSMLEAMGCGLPVCTTDVGEVRRVVVPGVNGQIVRERTPEDMARALALCLEHLSEYRGAPALESARGFVPERILAPLYANYRRLAETRRPSPR